MTFQSVTFGTNGEIVSTDGQALNRGIQNSALSDSQKANVGIHINTSDFARFNTGSGPASQGSSTSRVQLLQDDGLVRVGGFEVRPEVAEKLAKVAPGLFVDPAIKAVEAAKAADNAKDEEAQREDLNRHPDEQIEAAHQHFVGEVSTQNKVSLLVYAHRGESPPADLLNRIADEMHVPLHEAVDKINAISMATQAQFTVLARSMGLDADKAADWIRENRRDTAMAASQAHGLRRDLLAWKPLLEQYKSATGDGVRR
jgi:hypothetical protein